MGIENNEAVIFTTWDKTAVESIKKWINTLDEDWQGLFSFIPAIANGKTTIIMAPDGSKKGWGIAKEGEKIRGQFISKLDNLYGDWIEVGYGEFGQKVLRGNCRNCYSDDEYAE